MNKCQTVEKLTKVRFGIDAMTQPEVSNHISVIFGIKQMNISFHRLRWYLAGSWYPAITSWTPITTRHMPYHMKILLGMVDDQALFCVERTSVIASSCPLIAFPHCVASSSFPDTGPRMMPTNIAGTERVQHEVIVDDCCFRTYRLRRDTTHS